MGRFSVSLVDANKSLSIKQVNKSVLGIATSAWHCRWQTCKLVLDKATNDPQVQSIVNGKHTCKLVLGIATNDSQVYDFINEKHLLLHQSKQKWHAIKNVDDMLSPDRFSLSWCRGTRQQPFQPMMVLLIYCERFSGITQVWTFNSNIRLRRLRLYSNVLLHSLHDAYMSKWFMRDLCNKHLGLVQYVGDTSEVSDSIHIFQTQC